MAQGRSTFMFAAGAVAGGMLVLAAYLGWVSPDHKLPWRPEPVAVHAPPAPSAAAEPVVVTAGGAPPASPLRAASTCPSTATIAADGPEDGQFHLERALASHAHTDPSAFLSVAREVAAEGRQHDAEVALIAACHVAEQVAGAESAPLADIQSQLGQQYVALAARENSDEAREALLQRASSLFSHSVSVYAAALGKNASKTRLAEERLASLGDLQTRLGPAAPLVVAAPPAAASRSAAPGAVETRRDAVLDTARMGAARPSLAARTVTRNEDLGQVDADLDRLYRQARSVARDPAGMQLRHQQALAQRNACRGDDACLRQWYAQRKQQLFNEF